MNDVKPRRVVFPMFELADNPQIKWSAIKDRRFDLMSCPKCGMPGARGNDGHTDEECAVYSVHES